MGEQEPVTSTVTVRLRAGRSENTRTTHSSPVIHLNPKFEPHVGPPTRHRSVKYMIGGVLGREDDQTDQEQAN